MTTQPSSENSADARRSEPRHENQNASSQLLESRIAALIRPTME
jgi:hypothetical protein